MLKVMIFFDYPSCHTLTVEQRETLRLMGIDIIAFPHNTTHFLQMLDQARVLSPLLPFFHLF